MNVGSLRIDPVMDGVATLPATAAFVGTTEEQWEPHRRFLDADGNVELALGGFLIRSGERVVLVDAGLGNMTRGPFVGGREWDLTGGLKRKLGFGAVGTVWSSR